MRSSKSSTLALTVVLTLVIGGCTDSDGSVPLALPADDATTIAAVADDPVPTAPSSYGDDPNLDRGWDLCEQGNMQACDELWWNSPPSSEYAIFGDTCGNRGGWWRLVLGR